MTEDEIIALWVEELGLNTWSLGLLGVDNPRDLNIDYASKSITWTQVEVAKAIREKVGTYISYVNLTDTWYAWNGLVHQPTTGDFIVKKLVRKYHEAMSDALSYVEDAVIASIESRADEGMDAASKSKAIVQEYQKGFQRQRTMRDDLASARGLENMVKALKVEALVPDDYFDNDQGWLVTRNCVFDLNGLRENGELNVYRHSPERAVTRYINADYNPEVGGDEESVFIDFLESSLNNSEDQEEIILYLRNIVGASFMGQSKMKTILNLLGPPDSGKSLFVDTLYNLGNTNDDSYSIMVSAEAIKKESSTNFEQNALKGRRFIGMSEPSSRDQVDDDFLKTFTGDNWVVTRGIFGKSAGWVPQGLLFIASNQTLKINTREEAIVARVKVIDFPYRFVENPSKEGEKPRDMGLGDKMKTEKAKSQILNWIVRGMLSFVNEHNMVLDPPKSIVERQAKVSLDSSSSLRWLEEYLEVGYLQKASEVTQTGIKVQANAHIDVNDAYQMYRLWCADAGEKIYISRKMFEEDIGKKYHVVTYSRKKKFEGLLKTNTIMGNPVSAPSLSTLEDEVSAMSGGFVAPPELG